MTFSVLMGFLMAKGKKMADLIDRNELFHGQVILVGTDDARKSVQDVMNAIWNAPTVAAVPVVRCKDCRFRQGEKEGFCYGIERYVSDDDYCSRGERREDGEE